MLINKIKVRTSNCLSNMNFYVCNTASIDGDYWAAEYMKVTCIDTHRLVPKVCVLKS